MFDPLLEDDPLVQEKFTERLVSGDQPRCSIWELQMERPGWSHIFPLRYVLSPEWRRPPLASSYRPSLARYQGPAAAR
jgi:hypothetical protein